MAKRSQVQPTSLTIVTKSRVKKRRATRNAITLAQKREVLELLKQHSERHVAQLIGISKTQVHHIKLKENVVNDALEIDDAVFQ